MPFDPQKLATDLHAMAASLILPHYCNLQPGDQWQKTGSAATFGASTPDPVSIVDHAVEAWLNTYLPSLNPGPVLGEERVSENPALLPAIATDPSSFWVADPLDGTANFVSDNADFCTMAAYRQNGETVFSFIYLPITGVLAYAERGAGAYLNGERLAITPAPVTSGYIGRKMRRPHQAFYDALPLDLHSHGSAGIEYLGLARNTRQFSAYKKVLPWDHFPGLLLVEEARGHHRQWPGGRYATHGFDAGLITANTKQACDNIADLLTPVF